MEYNDEIGADNRDHIPRVNAANLKVLYYLENSNSVDWSEIFNYVNGSSCCWSFYRFRSSSGIWISISFVYINFRFRLGKFWNFVFCFFFFNIATPRMFCTLSSLNSMLNGFGEFFWWIFDCYIGSQILRQYWRSITFIWVIYVSNNLLFMSWCWRRDIAELNSEFEVQCQVLNQVIHNFGSISDSVEVVIVHICDIFPFAVLRLMVDLFVLICTCRNSFSSRWWQNKKIWFWDIWGREEKTVHQISSKEGNEDQTYPQKTQ